MLNLTDLPKLPFIGQTRSGRGRFGAGAGAEIGPPRAAHFIRCWTRCLAQARPRQTHSATAA